MLSFRDLVNADFITISMVSIFNLEAAGRRLNMCLFVFMFFCTYPSLLRLGFLSITLASSQLLFFF